LRNLLIGMRAVFCVVTAMCLTLFVN